MTTTGPRAPSRPLRCLDFRRQPSHQHAKFGVMRQHFLQDPPFDAGQLKIAMLRGLLDVLLEPADELHRSGVLLLQRGKQAALVLHRHISPILDFRDESFGLCQGHLALLVPE
jgi:hypothetical protein